MPNRGSVFHFCLRCTRGIIFRMWEAAAQDRCFPELCRTLRRKAAAARMGRNTFGIWNENAYQLWMDVSTLSMLMDELPEDSLRASQIADGLERYTRIVDFEQPG